MKIDFYDLQTDDAWSPFVPDLSSPNELWAGGGTLADAPVDVKATFDGAMWKSTRVDPDFVMNGVRLKPNFTVPPHSNHLRELIIVVGGQITVDWGEGTTRTVTIGEYWHTDPGTKLTMTAGPDGARYVETWPVWVIDHSTTWYDGDSWVKH
jgi:quercetin dioxygenase-like cupin family protein